MRRYGPGAATQNSVKPALTLFGVVMAVETAEYLEMLKRLIRRAGERCADADEIEFAALLALQETFDVAVQTAVNGMRARGVSWSYIGTALGVSKQAAQARWGKAA